MPLINSGVDMVSSVRAFDGGNLPYREPLPNVDAGSLAGRRALRDTSHIVVRCRRVDNDDLTTLRDS